MGRIIGRASFGVLVFIAVQGAACYQIDKIQYFPRDFHVGDSVRIVVALSLQESETVSTPERYPSDDYIEIRKVGIDKGPDRAVITIDIVSWTPGEVMLPSMEMGTVTLDSVPVRTQSLIEGESFPALRSNKPPLPLPGTRLIVLLALAGAVAGLLIAFPGFRILKSWARDIAIRKRKRLPLFLLKKNLNKLFTHGLHMPAKDFYYFLSRNIKEYLSLKGQTNFSAKTTKEIIEAFGQPDFQAPIGKIIGILKDCDRVKFAGFVPQAERILKDRLTIVSAAEALEKEG